MEGTQPEASAKVSAKASAKVSAKVSTKASVESPSRPAAKKKLTQPGRSHAKTSDGKLALSAALPKAPKAKAPATDAGKRRAADS